MGCTPLWVTSTWCWINVSLRVGFPDLMLKYAVILCLSSRFCMLMAVPLASTAPFRTASVMSSCKGTLLGHRMSGILHYSGWMDDRDMDWKRFLLTYQRSEFNLIFFRFSFRCCCTYSVVHNYLNNDTFFFNSLALYRRDNSFEVICYCSIEFEV